MKYFIMVHAHYLAESLVLFFDSVMLLQKAPAAIPRSLVLAQGNRRPIILLLRQSAFRTSPALHETNIYVAAHRIRARYRSCAEGGVMSDSLALLAQRGTLRPWALKQCIQLPLLGIWRFEALQMMKSVRTSASTPEDLRHAWLRYVSIVCCRI